MPLKLSPDATRSLLSNVAPELRSKLAQAMDQAAKAVKDPGVLQKLEQAAVQAMLGASAFQPATGKPTLHQAAPQTTDAQALDAAKQLIEYLAAQEKDPAKVAQLKGLEALLPYYVSTDAEKAHDAALADAAKKLTPAQWQG